MQVLVVYESMFGNTEEVARAIAAGVADWAEVAVVEVSQAPPEPSREIDLIVAGGPTHAFSMSRERTRSDAISRGAGQGEREFGLRDWLDGLPAGHHRERMATFDTRVASVRHLPGSAARAAEKAARRHGYEAASPAESFYVKDVNGPLLDGELGRARAWGRQLGPLSNAH